MTWLDALEIVATRTGVERYRWLCSEANPNPETRAGYRAFMLAQAGEPAPQPPPSDPWRAKIRACPHYEPGCCAMPAPFCTRFVLSPSRERCIECLSGSVQVDVP